MDKKGLILVISLIFIVFLSASVVSAATTADDNSTDVDVLQIEDTDFQEVENNDEVLTAKEVTIETTDNNTQIQEKINTLDDGDTINFQQGEYKDICIYVNKSVTINGNGATLYGYDRPTQNTTPDIILNTTANGGYAITNLATVYLLKTNGTVLKDINVVAGNNSGTEIGKDARYTNCVIYSYFSNNTQIKNTTIIGCSWGIWLQNCQDTIIENNKVKNQLITGIFSFQSPRTIIRNNIVTNAKNHGIDVRHQAGPNAQIINNTVTGSKEGIYLLHSKGHIVTENQIVSCSLSSITCCGAQNINIYNNKFYYSRIGVLLGGGAPQGGEYTPYNNITLGENEWKVDELPFPPSFQYYVAEAKSNYASVDAMMGTHTDSNISEITYKEFTGIDVPEPIVINYGEILKVTGTNKTITSGMTNDEIQNVINSLNNGDTLIFEENAVFNNISIYIDKNIKVIGNGATLVSHDTVSQANVPEKIINKTADGGYGISYYAPLYIVNTSNVVISNLNIKCKYPGYDTTTVKMNTPEYATVGIYGEVNKNLTITGCSVDGASWGIFLGGRDGKGCPNAKITNNKISNQYTTGILNFGGAKSIIANNTVTNAINHGIDVRFKSGSNVTVFNNTIKGSKEGIYLLHSEGHKVYGNTIMNSKISSITCYGSGNEYIFNNTLSKSRIAIILGGGYYNVTIGKNSFDPDKLPFPPTFEYTLVKSENTYYGASKVVRTFSDKEVVTITAPDVTAEVNKDGKLTITLIDQNNKAMAGKTITVKLNNKNHILKTDSNGTATLSTANLTANTYIAEINYAGSDNYAPAKANATIKINAPVVNKIATTLTASGKTVYLQKIAKGYSYSITLKDKNGKALAKKTLNINFNGKNNKATTNSKGVATVKLTATSVGSKKVTITFAGDNTYKASSKTTTIKITKEASKITASKKTFKAKAKNKKYTVTLKSKSGKAISKVKLYLKVKGKTYKATTNTKGKATFNLKVLTKKCKVTAKISFKGNKYFNKSSKSVKITVKK